MSVLRNRRGITLIELLCAIVFLGMAFFLLTRPSYRAMEIARTVTGNARYDEIIAIATFCLTLPSWVCIAVFVYRMRIRYGDLLYFPLMVGLPLGFAVVPFSPFSWQVYALLLLASLLVMPLVFFSIQSLLLLFYRATSKRKRDPIPEKLPQPPLGCVRNRTKPENIKEGIPHPNRTQAWENFYNSIGIHRGYALDAYLLDENIEEFREQLSTYFQKLLLHCKQPSGYIRFWCRETRYSEEIIEPLVALDFDGARNWAEYVRATLPDNAHILSQRDERIVSAICAAILRDEEQLEFLYQELKKPIGWLDRMITREPAYWHILIEGLVERNVERCADAIRIQAEEWYSPSLSHYCCLDVGGVAMTNLCRWRGIPVPALEPVVPERLILMEASH